VVFIKKECRLDVMGKRGLGYICAIGSAVIYGLCAVLTKQVTEAGLSVPTILFGRGLFGCIFCALICLLRKKSLKYKRETVPQIVLLGLLGTAATLFLLNVAYTYMAVGTATTIHFLYPAMVCLASALLFKERINLSTWIAIVVSFTGIALLAGDNTDSSLIGIILAILSAFTWAFYLIYIEHSSILSEDKYAVTFFICFVILVFGLVYGLISGEFEPAALIGANTFKIAFIALLNNVVATVLVQKGVELIGSSTTAVFSVFEPVSSIVFGVLLMNEKLGTLQLAGCVIILVSILFILICNNLKQKAR